MLCHTWKFISAITVQDLNINIVYLLLNCYQLDIWELKFQVFKVQPQHTYVAHDKVSSVMSGLPTVNSQWKFEYLFANLWLFLYGEENSTYLYIIYKWHSFEWKKIKLSLPYGVILIKYKTLIIYKICYLGVSEI